VQRCEYKNDDETNAYKIIQCKSVHHFHVQKFTVFFLAARVKQKQVEFNRNHSTATNQEAPLLFRLVVIATKATNDCGR